jgi:hypothetical protein
MIDYVDHLKILQEEQKDIFSLKGELDKRKQRLEETKKLFNEVNSFKEDFKAIARKEKEENYRLFQRGIKNCLVCGHKTQEENITTGTFNLVSNCTKCHKKCWLVGETYPCEICERTCLTPLIHHIDGNRENNEYENLIFICSDCHTAIHLGIGNRNGNINGRKGKRRNVYGQSATELIREYSLKYREGIKSRGDVE